MMMGGCDVSLAVFLRKIALRLPLALCAAAVLVPSLIERMSARAQSAPAGLFRTSPKSVESAEDLRRRWQLDAAETSYLDILKRDPNNVPSLLGLADISATKYAYIPARAFLERASAISSIDPSVLTAFGDLFLDVEEPERAQSYYQQARWYAPSFSKAIVGQARVEFMRRNYQGAETMLKEVLSGDSQNVTAREALARVYLEENRNAIAAKEAQLALSGDPHNVNALFTLCLVRVAERKPEEVRELANRVLELDPYHIGARRILAQYLNGKLGYIVRPKPPALVRYERGEDLSKLGRYREAQSEFDAALEIEPGYYRAWLALGGCALMQGDYQTALRAARQALKIDPHGALAHFQLSQAYVRMQEVERLNIGATDFRKRIPQEPPAKPLRLGDIFINYEALPPDQQRVIDQAAAPLSGFLDELRKKGAKHYLLPLDLRLTEVPGRQDLEDKLTFDGRYYSSVRGVGGILTVSGVEYLDTAARGGFHTIAHEFAHQVHTAAFDRTLTARVQQLYKRALKKGRTLDYYAAANEYEYFAQGYEAFISDFKRPGAGVTARHTRQELKEKDPDLYKFLEEITTKVPAVQPAAVPRAFRDSNQFEFAFLRRFPRFADWRLCPAQAR